MIWNKEGLIRRRSRGGKFVPPEYRLHMAMHDGLLTAFRGYLLGFFLTGGFFSPPLGLIRAR